MKQTEINVYRTKRKNIMKKLVLSLLLSGIMFAGFAQEKSNVKEGVNRDGRRSAKKEFKLDKKSAEEIAQLRTDRMDQKLKFTDKQRKEIYALQLDQAKKDKMHAADRKESMERMKKERMAQREKLMKNLSPDQQKLYKESFAENRKQHRMRRSDDRPMRRDRNDINHKDGKNNVEVSKEVSLKNS